MHLENLNLFNYRNYADVNLRFDARINCFVGNNGVGKTNLLDAIYFLSLTRSAFGFSDSQSIRHGEKGFKIKGGFSIKDILYDVLIEISGNGKKQLSVNAQVYEKQSEHVGRFPAIFISPYDTDIIREGPELRRKFFDTTISQINHQYLNTLIRYNHFLKQRNSLLKSFADGAAFDGQILDIYDNELSKAGEQIFDIRVKFLHVFEPIFKDIYEKLAGVNLERVSIVYQSDLQNEPELKRSLKEALKRDMVLQRTTVGPHKDDFRFSLSDFEIRKYGSQGQLKSFAIALKLAQYEIIRSEKGFSPIILLDDIFDKLDDERIAHLMVMLEKDYEAQLFITDARPDRTKSVFQSLRIDADLRLISSDKQRQFA